MSPRSLRRHLLLGVGTCALAALTWLVYYFGMTFDNWPWTVRHSYGSGTFAGDFIQSTKEQTLEQVLAVQRKGSFGKLVLIDPEGVFAAQQAAMDDVRGASRERFSVMWAFAVSGWSFVSREAGRLSTEQFIALLFLPPVGLLLSFGLWRWSQAEQQEGVSK